MSGEGSKRAEERLATDSTSELWGEHRARYRFAMAYAAGSRTLDMASGAGFGTRMLREAGAAVCGSDLDAPALREARSMDSATPVVRADAACQPFPDGAFDLVVSFETIEHVPDPSATLAELARVLRPSGRLILSTPNRAFGPPELHTGNPFHLQEFTVAELRTLLGSHFDAVAVYGQWVDARYRFVPFLLVQADVSPSALAWKALNRLPFRLKDGLSRRLTGQSFYPGENDYRFVEDNCEGAHALIAVAQQPRRRPGV